jgi:DNA-binding winged helix-turn-helix (wHTH) protein
MRLRFADCVFDSETREVVREGRAVALSPKAFQLLHTLIRERPRAVSKAQLQQIVWPDIFVSEANLANLVADLRAAIGDHARQPHIIRTVQRFGYAFHAHAEPFEGAYPRGAPVVFKLVQGAREIALVEGQNVIGRDETAVAWIDVHSVSRRHASITVAGETAMLEDLGSKNGTFVGGRRVNGQVLLRDGDVVRLGTAEVVLRCSRHGLSTETALGI